MKKTKIKNKEVTQIIKTQIADLLNDAKELSEEVDFLYRDANKRLDKIEKDINLSLNRLDKIYFELDKIDQEIGDDLDRLILEQCDISAK
jgi:hypothetical protein